MNVEPNRGDFAISAGTEPLMESNPPSFVSQNISSDIFNNNPYLVAHGHTNPNQPGIRYIPKTGPSSLLIKHINPFISPHISINNVYISNYNRVNRPSLSLMK